MARYQKIEDIPPHMYKNVVVTIQTRYVDFVGDRPYFKRLADVFPLVSKSVLQELYRLHKNEIQDTHGTYGHNPDVACRVLYA